MTPEEIAAQVVDCSGCCNISTFNGTHDQYCRVTKVAAAIRDAYELAATVCDTRANDEYIGASEPDYALRQAAVAIRALKGLTNER